ncbi:cache domain-containing protein, partial [Helicobacter cinaedi]
MFTYLSVKYKISILIFGSFLSFAVLVGLVFIGEKEIAEQSVERLHDLIQEEVEQKLKLSTDSVAQSLGALIKGLDEKQQIAVIAKAIEDFRFEDDKSGYYFTYKEYVPVAHPTRKDLLGKSLAEAKDVNGVYYVRELFDTAKSQSAKGKFVHFVFSKPLPDGTLGNAPKIAYAAMIPNTDNIWISTGVYADTFEQYAQNSSTSILSIIRSILSNALIIASVCFVVIFVPLMFMFYRSLLKSIGVLQHNMMLFFKYLNRESKEIKLTPLHNKDEFGAMAKSIEQNVEHIAKGLESDQALVAQSLQVIDKAKQGYIDSLIESKGSNPQLNNLRDSVNELLKLLMTGVGKDLNEINRVFESYVSLDFTT